MEHSQAKSRFVSGAFLSFFYRAYEDIGISTNTPGCQHLMGTGRLNLLIIPVGHEKQDASSCF
jgi:hypothetical protein